MIVTGIIILISGLIGGYANFHRFEENSEFKNFNLRKSLLTGLVASATVPLFLNMVSSDLLKDASVQGSEYKYFIFAGFCLVAAFFSNRFLQSVSDKVIQDLQNKTQKIEVETSANTEKVEALVETNSDDVEEIEKNTSKVEVLKEKADDIKTNDLLDAFTSSKFSFRTIGGLSKTTGIEIMK